MTCRIAPVPSPSSRRRALAEVFGVYVHWPFCKAKCPYCDFNSHVRHTTVPAMDFAEALAKELAWFATQTPGRAVSSVFFGGGTPSLMPPSTVDRVLDAIGSHWTVAADCEITLEANPTSAEARNFAGYRAAGVNRLSVGVQALNDDDLRALGRQHTVDEALAAFRLAARTFPRVSFDLIYARPGQTPEKWCAELAHALAEQTGHMSLYQLTIEPGTAFGDLHARGNFTTLDDDIAAELYDITQDMTMAADLPAYEISNHARPGEESRHNLLYWRYGEYVGVGPGAHSRLIDGENRRAIVMERHPETWRAAVTQKGHGIVEDNALTPQDQAAEYLLMGLRTREGIDLSHFEALAGRPPNANRIADYADLELAQVTAGRLIATIKGRRVLNSVIAGL
jgi:putative oxygen-independent coproporphyrinogen III oxidase